MGSCHDGGALVMEKLSLCGRNMKEVRECLDAWLLAKPKGGAVDNWRNYCMAYWLKELGGLGAVW